METLSILMAFAVAAIPLARLSVRRPFWVEVAARPLPSAAVAAGGVAVAMAAIWTARRVPAAGPLLAGGALLATTGFALRARPSWGRRRGLPPGSLALVDSLDALARPGFYGAAARRWGPVFKMAQFHRPVVCITDLSMGSEVLDGQRDHLRAPSQPFGRVSPGAWVAFLDEAGHPRHRPILGPALDAGVVDDARQGVEAVVRGELERMVDASRGLGIPPGPHLDRIVLGALLRIVSGRAPDARRISDLQARFAELGAHGALAPGRPEQNAGRLGPLVAWMRDAGEEVLRRGAPATASSSVLAAILDDDPGHLADEILLENLVLLVLVTRSNVRGVLGWTLKELADRPARVAEVRGAAPESASGPEGGRRERAARFVSEVLRLHQSEFIYREVERDLAIGDYRVPRGWLLRVCVREAHRDPNVFVDPLEFRPDRFAERRWEDTEYRPFSDGSHSSFGAAAARTIAGVLVEQVAAGFEVRGVADGPVEREGNRHWNHWRPSRSFRVVVGRRDGPGARSPGVDL